MSAFKMNQTQCVKPLQVAKKASSALAMTSVNLLLFLLLSFHAMH